MLNPRVFVYFAASTAMSLTACAGTSIEEDDISPTENCASGGQSNLVGVAIHFPPQRCSMTLAEARSGTTFQYEVIVENSVGGIVPLPVKGCAPSGAGGLLIFAHLFGNDEEFYPYDTDPCDQPNTTPVQLNQGTYDGSLVWFGLSQNGLKAAPDDHPFVPGTYNFEVVVKGSQTITTEVLPFEVRGVMQFQLVP